MGKHTFKVGYASASNRCIGCHSPFVGPGDRCPPCRDELRRRRRRRRKPR